MRHLSIPFLLLLSLVATFIVYLPGMSGQFVFDDGPNIALNARLEIHDLELVSLKQAAFSFVSGPLMRPISMLSFALNRYATGLDPYYFKITNIVIHLLNGVGIFVLTSLLLCFYRKHYVPGLPTSHPLWVALVVAAAWLLHPFNLTSVLYIVQRMTSLSAFFSIWGLIVFLWGRTRIYEGKSGISLILASLLLFTPLAAFSKENGVLLPLFMLVIEITLFNFQAQKPATQRLLGIFYGLAIALPAILALAYMTMHPEFVLGGYQTRGFSLSERLMTEVRVIFFYLSQIILPNIAQMGLFHDDIVISRNLFQPITTVAALVGIAGLVGAAVLARKRAPLLAFGILFFLAGHLLESTIFALEIAHEHRNYLPMYGILLPLFYYLLRPLHYTGNLRWRQIGAIFLIGLFSFSTFARAEKWGAPFTFAQSEVAHHPNSVRANDGMASVYEHLQTADPQARERNDALALQYYEKAIQLNPNMTHGLFRLIILNSTRGQAINPDWIKELRLRLKNAPFEVDIGDKLYSLVLCQENRLCKLTREEMDSLFEAALSNPGAKGENRSSVLFVRGVYLINVIRDSAAALKIYYQMTEAAPSNLENRLNLIKLLVALKHDVAAREQLIILARTDKLGLYTREIAQQRSKIPP